MEVGFSRKNRKNIVVLQNEDRNIDPSQDPFKDWRKINILNRTIGGG